MTSDPQKLIQALAESGLTGPQMALVAQLALAIALQPRALTGATPPPF
jgi:hypothetical protein